MSQQISTLSMHNNIIENINSIQSNIIKSQLQISQKNKIVSYSELSENNDLENYNNLTFKRGELKDYKNNNKVILTRLMTTDQSVNSIITIASEAKSTITLMQNPLNKNIQLSQLAKTYLTSIADNLNIKFEGRYLFAGTNTNIKPIKDLSINSNLINNQITANYYQGNNNDLSVNLSSELTINYNIKGNDPAFKKLIGALNKIIIADQFKDQSMIKEANNLLDETINSLIQMQLKIGNNIKSVENLQDQYEEADRYLAQNLADYEGIDLLQVTDKLNKDIAALQASYMAVGKISRLSLTEYLR